MKPTIVRSYAPVLSIAQSASRYRVTTGNPARVVFGVKLHLHPTDTAGDDYHATPQRAGLHLCVPRFALYELCSLVTVPSPESAYSSNGGSLSRLRISCPHRSHL